MIGIAEQNLDAELLQHILRHALDRSQRSNRHKNWRLNLSMGSDKPARACRTTGRFNLHPKRHRGIVTDCKSGLNRSEVKGQIAEVKREYACNVRRSDSNLGNPTSNL